MKRIFVLLSIVIVMGGMFTSCSDDKVEEESYESICKKLFTTEIPSVVNTPFFQVTDRFNLSLIDTQGKKISAEGYIYGGKIDYSDWTNTNIDMKTGSIVRRFCKIADGSYTYKPTLKVGDVTYEGEGKTFTVKINPDGFLELGEAKVDSNSVKVPCRFIVPEQYRDQFSYYLYCYAGEKVNVLSADSCVALTLDKDGRAEAEIMNLMYGRKYKYLLVMHSNAYSSYWYENETYCSKEKSFETEDLDIKFTLSDVSKPVEIGNVNLTYSAKAENASQDKIKNVGICYSSTNKKPTIDDCVTSGEDGKVLLTALSTNTTYYYRVYAEYYYMPKGTEKKVFYSDVKSFTTPNINFSVGETDLGLQVKWYGCNLGASKPEEYGNFYNEKKEGRNQKKDEIDSMQLPEGCRLPNKSDWEELEKNCDVSCVCHKGVFGYACVSKINGKAIFIPGSEKGEDEYGYYWLSGFKEARHLENGSFGNSHGAGWYNVRVVKEKEIKN